MSATSWQVLVLHLVTAIIAATPPFLASLVLFKRQGRGQEQAAQAAARIEVAVNGRLDAALSQVAHLEAEIRQLKAKEG